MRKNIPKPLILLGLDGSGRIKWARIYPIFADINLPSESRRKVKNKSVDNLWKKKIKIIENKFGGLEIRLYFCTCN